MEPPGRAEIPGRPTRCFWNGGRPGGDVASAATISVQVLAKTRVGQLMTLASGR